MFRLLHPEIVRQNRLQFVSAALAMVIREAILIDKLLRLAGAGL
jgi:hypothetical protein